MESISKDLRWKRSRRRLERLKKRQDASFAELSPSSLLFSTPSILFFITRRCHCSGFYVCSCRWRTQSPCRWYFCIVSVRSNLSTSLFRALSFLFLTSDISLVFFSTLFSLNRAPTFASVIALVNDARKKNGKGTVGWINPTLYANPSALTDITTGSSLGCGASNTGFNATTGYDLASGLGSPKFAALRSAFGA